MDRAVTEMELNERLSVVEARVQTLAEAVRALSEGLERVEGLLPRAPEEEQLSRAARLAHEILLAQGM